MKKKNFDRMLNKVHKINLSPLSTPILIKKLLPLNLQENYNPILREWYGPKQWSVITETSGVFEAFKQSEDWNEIGTIGIHDYKCVVNDNLGLVLDDVTNYQVERLDNNKTYEVVFYREYIGEVQLGLRPVIGK